MSYPDETPNMDRELFDYEIADEIADAAELQLAHTDPVRMFEGMDRHGPTYKLHQLCQAADCEECNQPWTLDGKAQPTDNEVDADDNEVDADGNEVGPAPLEADQ